MKLASLLDSRQDGNDAKLQVFVIPAKAGIQKIFDNLDFLNLGEQNTSQFLSPKHFCICDSLCIGVRNLSYLYHGFLQIS